MAVLQPTPPQKIFWQLYGIAATSDDPRTHNAAILFEHEGIAIVSACNRFPDGVTKNTSRLESPAKYDYITHAEEGCIQAAARNGARAWFGTMYALWAPCPGCARDIINAGIKKLIVHKELHDKTPERWQGPIDIAVQMLQEAGVEYVRWSGKVGGVKHLFNGEEWEP